jgi:hypothetical protein
MALVASEIVIARNDSDEAIQFLAQTALDCFAEPVIGPATWGRTRRLAMAKLDLTEKSPCSKG